MPLPEMLLAALAITVAAYGLFIAALYLIGRKAAAIALARFIPDCITLLKRLLGDDRVPRRRKLVLVARSSGIW